MPRIIIFFPFYRNFPQKRRTKTKKFAFFTLLNMSGRQSDPERMKSYPDYTLQCDLDILSIIVLFKWHQYLKY